SYRAFSFLCSMYPIIRSEDNEELEQMLALMNKDWYELYIIFGKEWEERNNALEK
ncbi:hypothetical protein OP593_003290, partial [Enterococcus faecalis]|nr:hypothetical protein [Enterococcus faecalis]